MSKVGRNRSVLKAIKRDRSESEKLMIKLEAWNNEKNPWIVVPGTNKKEASTRVRANEYWGSPNGSFRMGKSDGTESV